MSEAVNAPNQQKLSAPWILGLSANGIVVGLLSSLVGLPAPTEFGVWIASYVVWGVLVRRNALRPFLTPFLASALSGVWVGTTQFALREAYVANNPWYAEQIAQAGGITPQETIGFGVAMGLGWGVVVGGVLLAIAKRRARNQPTT